ncbi:transcriptional regulator [Hoyosella rhizosphaerae]|uniref:Transcriptional regulator n=2 Tax=Hoyosella rhizosphaerae TaxID=1755582 RepID=A0A916XC94_9ACTN|nr:transcriptional regulator [Hoyosella rhizosphaerae]
MRDRVGQAEFADPQCPHFHLLTLVTGGNGRHEIDFMSSEFTSGAVWWVHPGQVQRWGDVYAYDATVVLFEDAALDSTTQSLLSTSEVHRQCCWHEVDPSVLALFEHLAWSYGNQSSSRPGASAALLRHNLATILLTLRALTPDGKDPARGHADASIVELFSAAVERGFATTRSVGDYAHEVGYSEKTLTRSVRAATGFTAKQYIDARVMLESKRLLAHTRSTTSSIATQLGFTDVSNFAKFFATRAGMSPSDFRTSLGRTNH